jgi:aminopeptidase YwaD
MRIIKFKFMMKLATSSQLRRSHTVFKDIFTAVREEFSGKAARNYVAAISQFHRIQASPGYRQAAKYCLAELRAADLDAEMLAFPANEQAEFWSARSFQEWEVHQATLHLVSPEQEQRRLADFRNCPLSLIQRSVAFDGEAEIVVLEDGEEESAYEGLDLRGKVVLTQGDVNRVRELAVEKHGAVGILFDGMRKAPPVRERIDLPDALQYTSFWWRGGEQRCFGFVLSPREGDRLRALIKKQMQDDEEPVRVRAQVDARLHDGSLEVVTALIPGGGDEEVIVITHLCHPQPSANDNASGSATALEMARTLQRLISTGRLAQPQRSIRFLWVPEMTGTFAYLATHETEIPHMIAGVNLDMVGQNQELCGCSFLIECPPAAMSSFAPDLMERLREELFDGAPSHTGLGGYPLFRHAVTPFSGGSDHYILSDPSVGVPTPMLIQWPDKFYHTSEDTLDKVDPAMLSRIGSLAATYSYFLAVAGPRETTWLGHEMVTRHKARLDHVLQQAMTEVLTLEDGEKLARLAADLDRQVAYLIEREREALNTLHRLWPAGDALIADLQHEVTIAATHELDRLRSVLDQRVSTLGLDALPPAPRPEPDEWDTQAQDMFPRRCHPGPASWSDHQHLLSPEDREHWWKLIKDREAGGRTLPTLAQYWADGERTVLEIADLVEMETGQRDMELLVEHFRLLAKMGLVELNDQ